MLCMIGLSDPLNPFDGGPTTNPWGVVRQRPPVMDSIRTWVRLIEAAEQPEVLSHADGVKLVRYGPDVPDMKSNSARSRVRGTSGPAPG